MDSRKDEGKAIEKVTGNKDMFIQTGNVVWDNKRREIRDGYDTQLALLDKMIKSRWLGSNQKWNMKMFRAMLEETKQTSLLILNLSEFVSGISDILGGQFKIIEVLIQETRSLKGTSKEITELKSKMDDLLNNPAVQEIQKAIQNMQNVTEKIDKNRRQILRDTLV